MIFIPTVARASLVRAGDAWQIRREAARRADGRGREFMKPVAKISGLFAAVSAAALTATPSSAQEIDRIIAFGDSYADTSIGYNVLVNDPGFPATAKAQVQTLYPTKRFSGGSNY